MTSACQCYFETQHLQHNHPAMRELERDVLGCDFGATSWTTKSQADAIPAALGLRAGFSLLEIGAGTGWPGIYLAERTGCDVTLLDIPFGSLKLANQRATEENIQDRCRPVAASGSALPFIDGSFDAVGHSDVLCCLPDKLGMLQECRRVLKNPGSRMLYYVIAPSAGLSTAGLRRACEVGPPFVETPASYNDLLSAAGWVVTDRCDLTAEYHLALQRLADGLEACSDTLQKVLGSQELFDQVQHRRDQIAAIEDGLLEREMVLVEAV